MSVLYDDYPQVIIVLRTLKGKLSLIYIGLVILIAVVGISGFTNLYRQQSMIDNLMTDNYNSINALTKMLEAVERQDSAILIFIHMDRQTGSRLFSENHMEFLNWFAVEKNNITELNENEIVERLSDNYQDYFNIFADLQNKGQSRDRQYLAEYYDKSVLPLFNDIKKDISALIAINEDAMFRSKVEASASTRKSMNYLIILSVMAVLLGFLASRHFTNRLLYPLHQLAEGISRVKAGELGQQLDIKDKSETGLLADEFNSMTQRLLVYEQSNLGKIIDEKNRSVAIVKYISDPLLVMDMNYRTVLMNVACESFFEISESKSTGKHLLEVINDGNIFDHISGTIASGEEHREKIIHIRKKDDYYFNTVVTVIRDIEERITGIILLMENVTELKELEQVKTNFVATISHEFKTPLTSIMMGVNMLAEGKLGILSDDQREVLDTLKEDGERLTNLVLELLELSKIESGRAVYNMKPCSVHSIIDNSLKAFIDYAERKNVNLSDELDEKLPHVTADFEKITWVLNNLIGNALKYTNAGDFITIGATVEKDNVRISVKDTGIGIPPQYIDKIFDRFVHMNGRDIEVRGTGLGLAVAKEIINAHKGEITVKSQLDAGSVFSFTLPEAD